MDISRHVLKGLKDSKVLDKGNIMEHTKLFKTDIKVGESIYIPVDIVYYKEEKDDIAKYRLTRIINEEFLEMSKYPGIFMTMLSTLGYYAPDIIEGELITYSYKDIHIKTDGGSIYIFVKDAENFHFVGGQGINESSLEEQKFRCNQLIKK